jgi:hypothetical protein
MYAEPSHCIPDERDYTQSDAVRAPAGSLCAALCHPANATTRLGQAMREERQFFMLPRHELDDPLDGGMTVIRYPWMMDEA